MMALGESCSHVCARVRDAGPGPLRLDRRRHRRRDADPVRDAMRRRPHRRLVGERARLLPVRLSSTAPSLATELRRLYARAELDRPIAAYPAPPELNEPLNQKGRRPMNLTPEELRRAQDAAAVAAAADRDAALYGAV